jgi:integrase
VALHERVGLRLAQIVRAKAGDLDWERGRIVLPGPRTRKRVAAVPDPLLYLLEAYQDM